MDVGGGGATVTSSRLLTAPGTLSSSVLTLILLVVLGGGAGLMAVWLIDARGLSELFGRLELRSLRRTPQRDTTRQDRPEVSETGRDARFEPLAPAAATAATTVAYEPVEVPLAPLPAQSPAGRRDGKRVPAAYTAVEGTYRDVARVPLWRKLTSLASLLGILLLVALTVAALAGATFGLIAELVDGAVG
jgi:hypothetical protein